MRLRPPDLTNLGGDFVHMTYLVARREFVTRVRSRFFTIGTVVLMLALGGYIVLQDTVLSRAVTTVKIGFAGQAQSLATPLRQVAGSEHLVIQTSSVASASDGDALVRSGDLDAVVSGDPAAPDVAVKDQLNATVAATLDGLVKEVVLNRALAAAGVDPSAVATQIAAATYHMRLLDPNAADRTQREVVGIFVAVLLYVALLLYGQVVASGVVEEKQNRIVEILLATVRPRQLLLGKVVGVGLMGFLQLLLLGAVALLVVSRTQVISVPSVGVVAVAGGLLWFLLGFVFYALIFAAGGSLVSRQEDLGSVTGPLSIVIVGTYLAFFWIEANPDNPLAIFLSIVPPFAPVIMPARMATGDATTWQVVAAVMLTVLAIAGLNTLAARIYSNSVLRIGTRVRLMQAWRGAE